MQKKIGAILLIAGTCIGSGMIALPMVAAKLGLIPSFLLMSVIWFLVYYTSLINLELNLNAGQGLPLGELARRYSGKGAEILGIISLKILCYSLLAVYIYGGSSILQELIRANLGFKPSFNWVAFWYAVGVMMILLLSLQWIDRINRVLFFGLLGVVLLLIGGLAFTVDQSHLPLVYEGYDRFPAWGSVIPVVFTSFGFQVIFHTLTNYCNKDAQMLKKAFFWGSLIPAIVYMLWTFSILSVVYHHQPEFYHQMAGGKAEVGELIKVLSEISEWKSLQIFVWWISILAIATSVIGVGVGLCDSISRILNNKLFAVFVTILPAYIVAIFVPNAFLTVLGFAGMILAVIAILLPTYLFFRIPSFHCHYPELKKKSLIIVTFFIGIAVIVCEIFNML